ncbi:MAG TPA: PBP1A family penicillin-binding protein [Chthonomonadaceae bacterium]|nr:PBP1A family penicillin-binding protein [Chthonomonadaceae bacterium]
MIENATRAAAPARKDTRGRPRRAVQTVSLKKKIKTALAVLLLLVETALAIGLVCALAVFWSFSNELSGFESIIGDNREPIATKIWSEDGVLLGQLDAENRQPIILKDLGKSPVVDATISIEDHRFYEHPGVDVVGMARAALADLRGSATKQGASTLTQQLVRQPGIGSQFGLNNEKRLSRKVREAMVALRVEQLYSKSEILELYLNNVYYGAGAYGVQAAAKTYFHKNAKDLSLAQAALIAGLPQSPSQLSPFHHRQAALHRRDEVLDAMLEYGKITRPQYDEAKSEQVTFVKPVKKNNFNYKAPYFTTYVIRELLKNYAADFVYSGLNVKTTLNWKMQQAAERALRNGLGSPQAFGPNQGALISIDPQSGYIRAMVGGRDFHASQFNAVTQGRRQPGSTFKLFDYTAGFDTGATSLDDTFVDRPVPYPNDPSHLVKNYGGGYSYSSMTCRTAIMFSKNTIAVQVAQRVGIKTVIAYAYKMGITTPLAPYLPTALGASAVRPIDLCSAYSIYAAKGDRYHPMAIMRITDAEGNALDAGKYASVSEKNVVQQSTVQQIDQALLGVVQSGTGTWARGNESNGVIEDARGKTGTTSDNRDAWFAGYTPELTTVVWLASVHKHGKKLYYAEMGSVTGGHQAAPIWHDFMIQAIPLQRKFNSTVQHLDLPAHRTVAVGADAPIRPRRQRQRETEAAPRAGAADTPVPANPNTDPTTDGGAANPDNPNPDADETTPDGGLPGNGATRPPPGAVAPTEQPNDRRATTISPFGGTPAPSTRVRTAPPVTRQERPDPQETMVAVTVCGDTGDLANPYCDTYKTIRVTAAQAARMHRCRLHHAPAGEGR